MLLIFAFQINIRFNESIKQNFNFMNINIY